MNMADKPNKVLVTGGAGYVGSVLVKKLLEKGYNVKVIDNLLYNNQDSIKSFFDNPGFEFLNGSICIEDDLRKAIDGVDAVVHLAAVVGDPACNLKQDLAVSTNYEASVRLAELCREKGISRFVYASSCSVYGMGDNILCENSSLNPVSLYARTKIDAEKEILNMADNVFRPTVLRKSTLYGPSLRMRFDLVVNILTAKAVRDKKIDIFGGSQWRPLVHVEDAADAYISCLEAPLDKVGGQVFNVGSSKQNYQIIQLGNLVKRKYPDINVNVKEGEVDKRDYKVSFDKIESEIGYSVKKTVEGAIDRIGDIVVNSGIDYSENKYSNYLSLKSS
ncbi:MAG: NAD-dependent epimerase/dehydratase [Nanoarchaeota archaeon]|nr:NAD-dependent epimerase/dehydratase [Nanoarchaeota archaeon]